MITVATQPKGIHAWSYLTMGLAFSGLVVHPIAAAWVSFEASRAGRPVTARVALTARSPALLLASHFFLLASWVIGGLGAALASVLIWGMFHDYYGAVVGWWIVSWVAGVVCSMSLGYVAGLVIPRARWSVPTAFIGTFLLRALIGAIPGRPFWATQLVPTTLNETNLFVKYIDLTFIGQAIWYLAVSVLLLVLVSAKTSGWRQNTSKAAGWFALCAALGLLAVVSTNGQVTTGSNSFEYRCVKSKPEVCVNPAYWPGAKEVQKEFVKMNDRAAGTPLSVSRLEQNVAGVGDRLSKGARDLYLIDLGPGFAQYGVSLYVEQYGGLYACKSADEAAAHQLLDTWVETGKVNPVIAKGFSRISGKRRSAFLAQHWREYSSCTLKMAEVQ